MILRIAIGAMVAVAQVACTRAHERGAETAEAARIVAALSEIESRALLDPELHVSSGARR